MSKKPKKYRVIYRRNGTETWHNSSGTYTHQEAVAVKKKIEKDKNYKAKIVDAEEDETKEDKPAEKN